MKILLQRVRHARVDVEGVCVGQIEQGLVALVGFGESDKPDILPVALSKLLNLRIFADSEGKLNLSLSDIKGSLLIISQFTLYANCSRGRRPDFTHAAPPELARELYEGFCHLAKQEAPELQTGIFGADMQLDLLNDGPITIMLEF